MLVLGLLTGRFLGGDILLLRLLALPGPEVPAWCPPDGIPPPVLMAWLTMRSRVQL